MELELKVHYSMAANGCTHFAHIANNEFVGVDNPQTTYSVPKNTYKCIHTSEKQIKTMGV